MAIYAIDFDNTLAITRFPEIVAPNKKNGCFCESSKSPGTPNNIVDKQSRGRPRKCRGMVQSARACI